MRIPFHEDKGRTPSQRLAIRSARGGIYCIRKQVVTRSGGVGGPRRRTDLERPWPPVLHKAGTRHAPYAGFAVVISVTEVGSMIMMLSAVPLYVADQERSKQFYADRLGFEVRTDAAFGPGQRWLEVAPKGAQTAFAIVRAADFDHARVGGPGPATLT